MMFWEGGVEMVNAAGELASGAGRELVVTSVMHGIDAFLFGIVLVIFAYAIAFGFVFDSSIEGWHSLPAWMRISSISELKNTLVEVILLYLLVDFATDWAELEGDPAWTLLTKPLSILAIAAAFGIFSALHGRAPQDTEPTDAPAVPTHNKKGQSR